MALLVLDATEALAEWITMRRNFFPALEKVFLLDAELPDVINQTKNYS